MFQIQNRIVVAGSTEVSNKVFDGGDVRAAGVLEESGGLVSHTGDAPSCALLDKVEIFDNREVMKPMAKGRH